MKLHSIYIKDIRGIRELEITPKGKNFVIWGPNGSGKSAVVDALDFLLTGNITRLTGEGTRGITLSKHGPHIDHQPKDSFIQAEIKIPNKDGTVIIKRAMHNPKVLECEEADIPYLDPIINTAQRAQYVLTRREILKFVTAESSTRAQQIQNILNISEIELTRKALVKTQRNLHTDMETNEKTKNSAEDDVCAAEGLFEFNRKSVLEFISAKRAILGGKAISEFKISFIKSDLKTPSEISAKDDSVNTNIFETNIKSVKAISADEKQQIIEGLDQRLRGGITSIKADPELLKSLKKHELNKLGLELIDDSGDCPLCDTPFPPGELGEQLTKKLESAVNADKYQTEIDDTSGKISRNFGTVKANIEQIITVTEKIDSLKSQTKILRDWKNDLDEIIKSLIDPIKDYPLKKYSEDDIKCFISPDDIEQILDEILKKVKAKYPEPSEKQTAWDRLNLIEDNLKKYARSVKKLMKSISHHQKAAFLTSAFEAAKDEVLNSLYNEIKDDFVKLYRELHHEDEGDFDAKFQADGPGLSFEVDFYGRGEHPPHALHSEGHQDSMGLCLYFVLSEKLLKSTLDLLILDDVVMSVDAGHRRRLCGILSSYFPNRQFLITTHDKTWASQLSATGVIDKKNMFEFFNWSVDFGPQVNDLVDLWDRINGDLDREDVPGAAAKLRRGSEEFFGLVCDSLYAKVPYKLNASWELGELMPNAYSQYSSFLKKAKNSAFSWNLREDVERFKELASVSSQIYTRTKAEQWGINYSVHYNNWHTLNKNDFEPIVEAFQDIFGLFKCSKCDGILFVFRKGFNIERVSCKCSIENWNLVPKNEG